MSLEENGLPYALKHNMTSELLACRQINKYELSYYGLKIWDSKEEALSECEAFLSGLGAGGMDDWSIVELDENKVKIGNAKLNNQSWKRLILNDDGSLSAVSQSRQEQ